MPSQPRTTSSSARSIIASLAQPQRIADTHPFAARFIYSLRLIALHERARRDPVPELTTRLGSVATAAKALALGQAIGLTWPENIHVSRFCCPVLTHDEATIATLLDCAERRDRTGFDQAIEGLIRPKRVPILWDAVVDLIIAEMQAA